MTTPIVPIVGSSTPWNVLSRDRPEAREGSVKIQPTMNQRKRPSLVEQVRERLLAELTTAKLEPGAKLANETELAERFEVSRATIREAVRGLMDAGYVTRRHGS